MLNSNIISMKILQLCRKFPYPLKDGEAIAVSYLAKAYKRLGHELTLLSFNTIKTYFDTQELPTSFDHYTDIHTVYLDNRVKPIAAFLNLFTADSYFITRFINSEFKSKLKEVLISSDFDIVQLEGINLAPYIPIIREFSTAKVVLRSHNVEFEIWERVAATTSFPLKRWYLSYLVRQFKAYEIAQFPFYDFLLAMSQRDLDYFRQLGLSTAAMVAPIGLDLGNYSATPPATMPPYSISFIGSLDWMPNQDGLKWFLDQVWPLVYQIFPSLSFHIAGRNTPKWVFARAGNGVVVHGEVPDATRFIQEHPISIVPLFSGSGMRVKILECMALGRVVLTTPLGVEGISATPNENILVGTTADQFCKLLKQCFQQPKKMEIIAANAQAFIIANYDNISIGKTITKRLSKL